MEINCDDVRYGRNWRYGTIQAPNEDLGSVESVVWLAFPSSQHRAQYAADLKASGDRMDFLSEQEMAIAIGVKSRQDLWDYFDLTDAEMASEFIRESRIGIYGKSDPMAKAPNREE